MMEILGHVELIATGLARERLRMSRMPGSTRGVEAISLCVHP